jgi:hypothetical protein
LIAESEEIDEARGRRIETRDAFLRFRASGPPLSRMAIPAGVGARRRGGGMSRARDFGF